MNIDRYRIRPGDRTALTRIHPANTQFFRDKDAAIGLVALRWGRSETERALESCAEALRITQAIDDRQGEGYALSHLARSCHFVHAFGEHIGIRPGERARAFGESVSATSRGRR